MEGVTISDEEGENIYNNTVEEEGNGEDEETTDASVREALSKAPGCQGNHRSDDFKGRGHGSLCWQR